MTEVGVEKDRKASVCWPPDMGLRELEQKLGQTFCAFLFPCHAALPPWRTVVAGDILILLILLP